MIFSGFVPVAEGSSAGEVGSAWPFPLLDPRGLPSEPKQTRSKREEDDELDEDETKNLQEFKGIVK